MSSTLPSKSTLDAQSATGTVIAWKKPNSGRTRCANGPSVRSLAGHLVLPEVDEKVLAGLKFSDALPQHLAVATLARRLADLENASHVWRSPSASSAGLEGPWGAVGNRAEDALWRAARAAFAVFLSGWCWPMTASAW